MKRFYWALFLIYISYSSAAQRKADYGVFAGVSSYIGDINPNRLLYAPLPACGIFYRFNFNPRQALRADIFYGGLRGSDLDFKNAFQQKRAASFRSSVSEFALQYEFNFFKYSTEGKLWDFTPYLAAGLGVAVSGTGSSALLPVIPFSLGFKANIYKNLGLEAEYSFRKTFYDNFDGLKDFISQADISLIHNNDWYTFTGIGITWKILNRLAGCPAFKDTDPVRK